MQGAPETQASLPARTSPGREALLAATITVGLRDGLTRVSYRKVADEVGVAHGLVRHHFGTLEDLIAESLIRSIGLSLDVTGMGYDEDAPGAFDENFAARAEQHSDIHAFQYEVALEARRRPKLKAAVEQYYERYRAMVQQRLLSIGIDDDGMTDLVWFVFDGLVFRQSTSPDTEAAEIALQRLQLLLALFRERGTAGREG
jgi:AcrR family transcriptional regulator